MDFSFLEQLQWLCYSIKLRFTKDAGFRHFYHGPPLYALLCQLLNSHPLVEHPQKQALILIHPVESGQLAYSKGDFYHFAITHIFPPVDFKEKLTGAFIDFIKNPPYDGVFSNNFVLESITEKTQPLRCHNKAFSENISLELVSPLRIEKNSPGLRGFFDIHYFDLSKYFKLIYQRVYNILRDQKLESLPAYSAPKIPVPRLLDKNLIWLDVPYGKSEQAAKTLGGLLGTLRFQAELDDMWKRILWLGQFFHVGQAKSFGFGRYYIRAHNEDSSEQALITAKPARTFLNRAIDIENMRAAFEHVEDNRGMPGIDEQSIPEISDQAYDYLNQLISEINTQQYKPRELLGIIIDTADKKPRALAVPTVKDRILQRAVVQVLSPLINQLLEDSSYAYRKGFSRVSAARAIQKAYEDGYRYVLESDISAFFDQVDWDIMLGKLKALFYNDPVVDLIQQWITQPVIYEGVKITRGRGLPPGAVISPLLANLYLDEIDDILRQENFKLIRYAAEFAVLCKSKNQAQKALERVKEILKVMELEINPDKTQIASFEQGFQYLGYLFYQSMVAEADKENKNKAITTTANQAIDIPAGSWLSLVDVNKTQSLQPNKSPA